jgi:hypothetical protein
MPTMTNNVYAKGIRLTLVLEFDDVESPDSPEADTITELITAATDSLADEFNASRCYVFDVAETLWVKP